MSNITSINSSTSLTIDQVLKQLSDWRAKKGSQGGRIPDELWNMIFTLSDQYSEKGVRELLGISASQFKSKREQLKNRLSTVILRTLMILNFQS